MRVTITGAAGVIGRQIVEELSGSHELCLIDLLPVPGYKTIIANLAQYHAWTRWRPWRRFQTPRWEEAFEGTDVILFLANDPRVKYCEKGVLGNNIQMTWNVLQAAVRHQVSRVVYASSNWVVKAKELELAPACYRPNGPKISSDVSPRPITAYGITKAFGEIAGQTLVDEEQLESFVSVRIGAYGMVPPANCEARNRWIGVRDMRSLLRRCVEAEFKGFHIVYGISAQPTSPYDLSYTCSLLAWEPQQIP